MKINEKPIKIGKSYQMSNCTTFECAGIPGCPGVDGWGCMCFKDEDIFWNAPDEVCYVAESAFLNSFDEDQRRWANFSLFPQTKSAYMGVMAWSHNLIVEECKKFLKFNPQYDINIEEFAYRVFCDATWNLPAYNDLSFGVVSAFKEAADRITEEKSGK